MSKWPAFSSTIRRIVSSASVIVELLEAVLSDDKKMLRTIVKENPGSAVNLQKLIRASKRVAKTVGGRFEIGRLIDEYTFEAHWPTDDISLRRVYELYRRGELKKRLPAVDRRIA
jgi:hypothetical protein